MADPDVAARIDAYVESAPEFARPICRALRQAILEADERLVEDVKWGAPAFVHKGLVCSLGAFEHHVAVWFHKGSLLEDPRGVLQPGAKAKTMKQLRYTSLDEVDREALEELVRAAVDLNERGVRPPRKAIRVVVPKPLREALAAHPRAKAYFDSLPPSHRREYAEHVAEAKRPETVARRVAKVVAQLEQGKRPHERYRKNRKKNSG